jgi:MoaA/NifB/PqqE/SkfB family radical SAM enzyme
VKIADIVSYLSAYIKARFFDIKTPLLIGWDLTFKCNSDCRYCGIRGKHCNELSTAEALSLIDKLSALGTKRIHFGGGEPLLRDDIGKILNACKQRRIFSTLITNGILFEEKLPEIRVADLVKISIDGPGPIHDSLRQKGSFRDALNAIQLAKQNNIKIAINTTLSSYNLDYIDFILELSKNFDVPVKFQPVNTLLSKDRDVESLIFSDTEYGCAINKLMKIKKRGKSGIINSLSGLKYLMNSSRYADFKCCSGMLYFRITPEGKMYPCSGRMAEVYDIGRGGSNLQAAMSDVLPITCNRCLCTSTLELNLMYSLRLNTLRELFWYI